MSKTIKVTVKYSIDIYKYNDTIRLQGEEYLWVKYSDLIDISPSSRPYKRSIDRMKKRLSFKYGLKIKYMKLFNFRPQLQNEWDPETEYHNVEIIYIVSDYDYIDKWYPIYLSYLRKDIINNILSE